MKINFYISILAIGMISSCIEKSSNNSGIIKPSSFNTFNTDSLSGNVSHYTVINGAIGIISETEKFNFGDTIKIYDDKRDLISEFIKKDEYQVLALDCLYNDKENYKVRIDNNKIGYISKNSDKIFFQTWEEHILDVFSVGFNNVDNPLLKDSISSSNKIQFDKDEFYHPVQVNGDWLQVKWGYKDNWNYGWIRWKNGDKLIIELFYFA